MSPLQAPRQPPRRGSSDRAQGLGMGLGRGMGRCYGMFKSEGAAVAAGTGGICSRCGAGTQPAEDRLACEDCPTGFVGTAGTCSVECAAGTQPNEDRTACEPCATGSYSADGDSCIDCDADEFTECWLGATPFLVLYTVGIPLLLFFLLLRAPRPPAASTRRRGRRRLLSGARLPLALLAWQDGRSVFPFVRDSSSDYH